jgi:hypothetical protein
MRFAPYRAAQGERAAVALDGAVSRCRGAGRRGGWLAFFSRVFEFEAGDLLCTGTPGAAMIEHADAVGCRIDGFEELVHPVASPDPTGTREGST